MRGSFPKRLAAMAAAMLGLSMAAVGIVVSATPAFAVSCPNPNHSDHQAFLWTSNTGDVSGVRAGVKFLKDSALCDWTSSNTPWDEVWLSVEVPGTGTTIVQMGFIHDYNFMEINEWCKFWATPGTGAVAQNYGCTGYSVDDEENFSIHQDSTKTHYVLDDCGKNTTDYSNCTTKSMGTADFSLPAGAVSQEEFYGSCGEHEWGYSGDNMKIGSVSGSPILTLQGLGAAGQWNARDWSTQPDEQNCTNGGNYNWLTADSNPVHGVKWFDSRNTS